MTTASELSIDDGKESMDIVCWLLVDSGLILTEFKIETLRCLS